MEIAAYFWMEPPTQKPTDNPAYTVVPCSSGHQQATKIWCINRVLQLKKNDQLSFHLGQNRVAVITRWKP